MTDRELAIALRDWLREQVSDDSSESIETLGGRIQDLAEEVEIIAEPMDEGDKGAALMRFDDKLKALCKWLCDEENPKRVVTVLTDA